MPTQNCGSPADRLRSLSMLILGLGLLAAGLRVGGGGGSAAAAPTSEAVVVAVRPVVAGTRLAVADVRLVTVVASDVSARAAHQLRDALGRRLAVTLAPGDPVLSAEFQVAAATAAANRIVALSTDSRALPPGLARGDAVDIVRAFDGIHPATVLARGRIVAVDVDDGEHQARISLETGQTAALAIAGLPPGGVVRLLAVAG